MSRLSLRTIATILALSAALGLAACGGDGDNGPSAEGNEELLTSDGFGEAVDAVAEDAGDDAETLGIQITQTGANFRLQDTEGIRGLIYTGGELQEIQVDVVGPADLSDQAFPLDEVDPDAIDKIVEGVQDQAGGEPLLNSMTLVRGRIDGELHWLISARRQPPNSAILTFTATLDGAVEPASPAPVSPSQPGL